MTVRIGIVGCGHMGRLHAEKVRDLSRTDSGVSLVCVSDIDLDAARRLADEFGTHGTIDANECFSKCDACIVAVPTVDHFDVVRVALEAGLDVLVEKPIAATVEQGEDLLRLAHERQLLLQVGHQEWYNPAFREIRSQIHSPRFVEVHRLSPFPDRATDIDVVRDLMIHDLDILQQLIGAAPTRIEAIGIPVVTPQIDIANARVTYPNGCIANLTASRVSVTPMRKIRLFQRDGYFSIDLLSQSVAVFRRHGAEDGGAPRIEMEELKIDPDDALIAQLRAFLEALVTRSVSGVSGTDALGALGTALRVIDAMPSVEELE